MCVKGEPPPYNPGPWNQTGARYSNNCYSYALDQIFPSIGTRGKSYKPQPGSYSFHFIPPLYKCLDVVNLAKQDGLSDDDGP